MTGRTARRRQVSKKTASGDMVGTETRLQEMRVVGGRAVEVIRLFFLLHEPQALSLVSEHLKR